jgi:hypothetical protein
VESFQRSELPRRIVLGLLFTYALAFVLPVLDTEKGWQYFLMGLWWCWLPPFVVFDAFAQGASLGKILEAASFFAWWANPCFWIGCMLVARQRWTGATIAGAMAFVLSLGFLFNHNRHWPGAGYWLWTASMAGLALAGAVGRRMASPLAFHLRRLLDEIEYGGRTTESHDDRICRVDSAEPLGRPADSRLRAPG